MEFKENDKVIVKSRYNISISVIKKITPNGFIKVDNSLYDKKGRQRGGGVWNATYIVPFNKKDLDIITKNKIIWKLQNINFTNLTLSELKKIQNSLPEKINKVMGG